MNCSSLFIFAGAMIFFSGSCQNSARKPPVEEHFEAYWKQGKAELASYSLEQARYGEMHAGKAITVFVTEDFSKSKQVKSDDPEAAGTDAIPVLKLNLLRKFNTGIYSYSMMQSVFSPVHVERYPYPLKTSLSVQEWCGQVFTQFNLLDSVYRIQIHSYFESEGEQDYQVPAGLLEDGIWNIIRLAPDKLPLGEIRIVPGAAFARLRHIALQAENAVAELKKLKNDLETYSIHYTGMQRTLSITFHKSFPHIIESWEETYVSGWGDKTKVLTSRATLNKVMMLDYWNRNTPTDAYLRKEMELD